MYEICVLILLLMLKLMCKCILLKCSSVPRRAYYVPGTGIVCCTSASFRFLSAFCINIGENIDKNSFIFLFPFLIGNTRPESGPNSSKEYFYVWSRVEVKYRRTPDLTLSRGLMLEHFGCGIGLISRAHDEIWVPRHTWPKTNRMPPWRNELLLYGGP